MFERIFEEEFLKDAGKASKKDKILALEIRKKISQIVSCDELSIEHYKNLRGQLKEYKRVHVGSFVILFRVRGSTIYFERFKHHDEAYE